jgi:hypothetical protein
MRNFIELLQGQLAGHDIIVHQVDAKAPRPYRRQGKGIFVASVTSLPEAECTMETLYPLVVLTLSNALVVIEHETGRAHLVTPEMGHVLLNSGDVAQRLTTLASAAFVIDNIFEPDLEPALWQGDAHTAAISRAGKVIDSWQLLPAPFPIETMLAPEDMAWLKRVYGITGLSAGNFSERLDDRRFWMSASGVNKARLEHIGRDIMVVSGYDAERKAMRVSVPAGITPRRVSVDAIEHWIIYRDHPDVKAILHVHAWLEGVPSTDVHLPCGTFELGEAISKLLEDSAIVGQKNHGLTITGTSLDEILASVDGRLARTVPMS